MSDVGLFWVGVAALIAAIALFVRWLESPARISTDAERGIRGGLEGGAASQGDRWWHALSSDDSGGGGDGD